MSEFDNLNRLTSETIDGVNRQIGYDKTDQIKTVTGSNSEAYTYDANGNRTNNGYVTGANNKLLSDGTYNYEYDKEGNRTKRTNIATGTVDDYTWDYRNRLTGVISKDGSGAGAVTTQTVGYEYDVDNQRVSKTVNGVVEKYIIDRNQIAYVTDASGNQTFHYLYGTNVDAVMAQDSPTGMVWSLSDRLGSVNLLTDAGGVVVNQRTFDSFGRVLSQSNPGVKFRYGYTGREQDGETGLDYYRARYYDAANGRFISVDPAGFEAGDTNLYRYVGNSPTNATDPSGEFAIAIVPAIAIAGVGVVVLGAIALNRSGAGDEIGKSLADLSDVFATITRLPEGEIDSSPPPFPNPNNDRLRLGNGLLATYPSDPLPRLDGINLTPVPTTTNTGHGYQDYSWLFPQVFQITPSLPPQRPNGPISVDQALDLADKFLDPGIGGKFVEKGTGVQFIQDSYIADDGRLVTKRIGWDFNPDTRHVGTFGPHLNLQTQFNGNEAAKGSPYHDPHIPVDPNDIRPSDYKNTQR